MTLVANRKSRKTQRRVGALNRLLADSPYSNDKKLWRDMQIGTLQWHIEMASPQPVRTKKDRSRQAGKEATK